MLDPLVIPHRFCGPERSGNGGWTSGALASFVDGPAEVTLREPPPLDTPMTVERRGDAVVLRLGELLVAEARPATDPIDWPPFVDPAAARAAEERYAGHAHHEFPRCFTCGTDRAPGDGLRIFPGPVEGRDGLVASTWTPDASLTNASLADESPTAAGDPDDVTVPVTWAALDCPSVWAHLGDGTRAVLGRMTAVIERSPVPGETYVVVGQDMGTERRKRFGAAALYTSDGERVGASGATWIVVPQD